ncbi:MAG: TetR family transcriptional regulator, partial [Gammaproteobacteria bacterium]
SFMAKSLPRPPQNRAMSAEAKLERRAQILHAAEQLLKRHGHSAISVAEVARQAGIAKGTVYLYFKTKEEIYLGLHERWVNLKLDTMTALLQDNTQVDGTVIGTVMADVMLSESYGLVTASTCHNLMETHIELDSAVAFKLKLAQRLGEIGKLIEQRFPHLVPGSGARILVRAYAMTIGLWQLMDASSQWRKLEATSGLEVFNVDFATELHAALVAYWCGALHEQNNNENHVAWAG